jgi:signal transduction histidine kinase
MGKLKFKISSALKNIIGSDLINDDFIAVFELVKNSYDAHASSVQIDFKDIRGSQPKIIIKDNGKGMSYEDLLNKWLFVAYSAKKDGTEEDSYDFRDRIKVKRAYAGAKGIGRFSCDRLGHNLYLETVKQQKGSLCEALITDWRLFEGDLKDEFINVNVLHETLPKSSYELEHGTVLEISDLKSVWDRSKLLKLKDALAKLINPNTHNRNDSFKITLQVPDEKDEDEKQKDYKNIVNGEVKNLIFETLNLKTTKIVSKVSSIDVNQIETTLHEGGKLVYKIVEVNPLPDLQNLEYVLYFLNRSAKNTFSRRMGMQPIEYGHIFMYKNGLRVYPYGERGEDPLNMDNRKAQGYNRYLGTREVIGYISIDEPNIDLRETSSRGDGLIKTNAYNNLIEWFYTTLRRLEKYGVDIIAWGNDLSADDYIQLDKEEKQFALKEMVSVLTKSKGLISFETGEEIFDILNAKQEKTAKFSLDGIKKQLNSEQIDKDSILKHLEKVEHQIDFLKQIKDDAEKEAFEKLIENDELSKELDKLTAETLFDASIAGREKKDLLSLQHQIIHTAGNINWSLDRLIDQINAGEDKESLITNIKDISLEVQRIVSASRYVTNAGFNIEAEKITKDVVKFINEYVVNIYIPAHSFIHHRRPISISVLNPANIQKVLKFRPFEITVLLDNLFSNARKAAATSIQLNWEEAEDLILLKFRDDGNGIPKEIEDRIFDFRFSRSNGSGIGLYHVREILKNYSASIEVNTNMLIGAEFIIKFPL